MTLDASGNIYLSDNSSIRKITPGGVVSTFVGSATTGNTDGTGTNASFNGLHKVAFDPLGNLYAADASNHCIRKITPDGVVTTFAGTGAAGRADGTGTNAAFNTPLGIASDPSGNLYVTDSWNHRICMITLDGLVSTFAGSTTGAAGLVNSIGTSALFNGPHQLTFDTDGNLYVVDGLNYCIRMITTPAGVVTTIAGSGVGGNVNATGTNASFGYPVDIAIDGAKNLYVTDWNNNTIRKVTSAGVVTTFAGSGTAIHSDGTGSSVGFNGIHQITFNPAGFLYVSEWNGGYIRKITSDEIVPMPFYSFDARISPTGMRIVPAPNGFSAPGMEVFAPGSAVPQASAIEQGKSYLAQTFYGGADERYSRRRRLPREKASRKKAKRRA
jgi:sugar lactone lactonase YvrE